MQESRNVYLFYLLSVGHRSKNMKTNKMFA